MSNYPDNMDWSQVEGDDVDLEREALLGQVEEVIKAYNAFVSQLTKINIDSEDFLESTKIKLGALLASETKDYTMFEQVKGAE